MTAKESKGVGGWCVCIMVVGLAAVNPYLKGATVEPRNASWFVP